MFSTIEWTDEGVVMLDQRRLPGLEIYLTLHSAYEVAEAIRDMTIRGAPAIGVAAAMGLALGITGNEDCRPAERSARFEALARLRAAKRPTAVILFWAIDRMRRASDRHQEAPFAAYAAALKDEALA